MRLTTLARKAVEPMLLVALAWPAQAQEPSLTGAIWKSETIQGEPVIFAVTLENKSETPLLLTAPGGGLWLSVRRTDGEQGPPAVPSAHLFTRGYVHPPRRRLVWHANLWEYYDLSAPGRYRLTATYKSRALGGDMGQGPAVPWEGEVSLGEHEFRVLAAEGQEAQVYEELKPHLPEIWRDTGAPNVGGPGEPLTRMDELAKRIAQDHPDSVYLPYLWWRFFYWYGFRHDAGDTPRYMQDLARDFAEAHPEWPMLDQVRAAHVWASGVPGSPKRAERQPTARALRAFAAETDDLFCYVYALPLADSVERGPLGPSGF